MQFRNARILGSPSEMVSRESDKHLLETQKSFIDGQNQLKTEVEALRAELNTIKTGGLASPAPQAPPSPNPKPVAQSLVPQTGKEFILTEDKQDHSVSDSVTITKSAPEKKKPQKSVRKKAAFGFDLPTERGFGDSTINFPVKVTGKEYLNEPSVVLPSGSYVKGVLMTGVEAPEGKSYPVLLQLDYAYVIPNDKRLDLSGCFMIAKAEGDLSTERVQLQGQTLSCVSRHGGMFERSINAFVADNKDQSYAVMGSVNSKQDRVAAMAFLASIVSGIGNSIKSAQVTTQLPVAGGAQTLVTGDQAKYIGAGAAADAATLVTQWYLKQAEHLLPTINVGSGQEVWMVMFNKVELPRSYFTQNFGGTQHGNIYSYFTNLSK
ncbi:unnamed protein product [Sphagnum tenellum]